MKVTMKGESTKNKNTCEWINGCPYEANVRISCLEGIDNCPAHKDAIHRIIVNRDEAIEFWKKHGEVEQNAYPV